MTSITTGELAKRLQISTRTLRYYDQIGLVTPSSKGTGGKRYYSNKDILTLEKVLLLKSLSLSLEDSRKIITEQSTQDILIAHKSSLKQQLHELEKSIDHTNSLLNILKLEGLIDWEDLLSLVTNEETERDWQLFFSEDEQNKLIDHLPKLEMDDLSIKKWINLIKRTELCISKNVTPQSDEAQLVIEDLNILSEESFQGDELLMKKFWEVRKSEEASSRLRLYPIKPEIIEFIEAAYQYHE